MSDRQATHAIGEANPFRNSRASNGYRGRRSESARSRADHERSRTGAGSARVDSRQPSGPTKEPRMKRFLIEHAYVAIYATLLAALALLYLGVK